MAPSRTSPLEALSRSRVVTAGLLAFACAVSAFRLLAMIQRHAVNVLFWDQWDFLTPLRLRQNLWQLFSYRHGPVRLGLGYLFIDAVYAASGWDNRVEAFATAGLYFAVAALALLLKRRATGSLTALDVVVPALILSRTQYEIFLGAENAAHGPVPLLLAIAAPFCWEVRNPLLRLTLTAVLAFCAAFTGFAVLFVPCLAALLLIEAIQPQARGERLWSAAGVLACAGALLAFLVGYQFESAVECFQFPDPHPGRYLPFAGLVMLRIFRIGHVIPGGLILGSATALAGAAFVAFAVARVFRRERTLLDRTVFLWSSFGLLFAANAAVGRVCLGMDVAFATRYVAYEVPFWLAAYLVVARAADLRPKLRAPAAAGALAVAVLQWTMSNDHLAMRWFSEGKSRWRACYLATRDEARCNAVFRVYPNDGAPNLTQMLDYLAAHRLNLFKP